MLKIIQCSADEFIYKVEGKKLICFGSGKMLDRFENASFFICPHVIIDNNRTGLRHIGGRDIPIVPPEELNMTGPDEFALVITVAGYREIIEQMDSMEKYDGMECYIPYPFFSSGDATHIYRGASGFTPVGDGRRFHICARHSESYHAGSKAPDDISFVLSEEGIVQFVVHQCDDDLPEEHWSKKRMLDEWNAILNGIPSDGIVYLQHPFYQKQMKRREAFNRLKERGVRFVVFVHDYEGLRGESCNEFLVREERFIFNLADVLIIHNDRMKSAFVHDGYSEKKLINLELFDYLCNGSQPISRCFSKEVVVAGNLSIEKNPHINLLNNLSNIRFHLFGPNYSDTGNSDNLVYHGSEAPEQLPCVLPDGFGLVWGGDSLATCSGYAGEYLRFNNPHKLSLYLASGLPVVVWDESAMAGFVRDNNLGLVVHSLYELSDLLDSVSPGQYMKYAENAAQIGCRLRNGYYTKTAIKNAEERLEELHYV